MEQIEVGIVDPSGFGENPDRLVRPAPPQAEPGPLTRWMIQFLWEKDLLPEFVKWCQGLRPAPIVGHPERSASGVEGPALSGERRVL